MNLEILHPEVQQFINTHLKTDITKLVLKGSPFPNISIVELVEQIEAKKKSEKKLPHWFQHPNVYYPNKLNIEQTSSEQTALYKTNLIEGNTIIDITGGYGVDCWAFAKNFAEVIHCELNNHLSDIVKHNVQQFNTSNIINYSGDGISLIINNTKTYDWIYVDPSRRDELKGKVFLLKDCLPNIPLHLDQLLEKSNHILIKNSPLIDISSCIKELKYVKEIYVVALKSEVKEVLVHIEKDYSENITIQAINLTDKIQEFKFTYQQNYEYQTSEPLDFLFEPNAAILKSGGFYALAQQLNLSKIHQHSHLYTHKNLVDFPGRCFKILESIPYNKKQILKRIPTKKANITTRNFKESVANIRKKTGLKEGGNLYLFFTTNKYEEQIVLFCEKI